MTGANGSTDPTATSSTSPTRKTSAIGNHFIISASYILIPGVQLLSQNTQACFALLLLVYLFLGIAVISDIFMGYLFYFLTVRAIEEITSQTKTIKSEDEFGKPCFHQVQVWNPTIANLTLMALGSSAPEILLSVIETT